jgi:hypothetical protein
MKADNANVETLRYCAQRVARHNMTLAGPGSATWGDLNVVTAAQKPLWELFWGLFTGMFCSRNLEYRQIDNVFQEHLIVPREGKEPDRLTIWVSQSFIPFYDHLRRHYILPVYSRLRSSWHNMLPGKQKRSETIENPEGGMISRSANNSEIGPTQSLTNLLRVRNSTLDVHNIDSRGLSAPHCRHYCSCYVRFKEYGSRSHCGFYWDIFARSASFRILFKHGRSDLSCDRCVSLSFLRMPNAFGEWPVLIINVQFLCCYGGFRSRSS